MLKSKQPLPFDAPKKESEAKSAVDGGLDEDLDLDVVEDEEPSPDDDVDLGGDDDLGVDTSDGESDSNN